MPSLSLLAGPMGLVSDGPSMQRTETATAAAIPPSAEPTATQNLNSFSSTAYTLAYRCHQSAAATWSAAASAALPLIWIASQLAVLSMVLANLASRAAYFIASVALRLAYAAANNMALFAMEAWACKRAERIRRKIYFEIALVLLGPGGNLLLIVLWPGWIVLAAAVWALWVFI